jgi:C1A family cysteine protease
MQKSLIALVGLSAVAFAAPSKYVTDVEAEFRSKSLFESFQQQFNKQYTEAEATVRFGIFRSNLAVIDELNKKNGSPAFGINKFADLSVSEFKTNHLGYNPAIPGSKKDQDRYNVQVEHYQWAATANATQADWRTKGAVSPVKDQGQCGSCWAFSATEQVESAYLLAKNTMPILSPQQIVSCDTVDQGCNGGDTPTAYAYVKSKGLEAASTYPYNSGSSGADGTCTYSASQVKVHISGFSYATTPCSDSCDKQDEGTFSNNVAEKGPASICVNAAAWQFYTSGVMTATSCGGNAYTDLDHCVQVVGFDTEASSPYWIVRNSWNTNWGEAGFIRLAYGTNTCGIADEATFVQI